MPTETEVTPAATEGLAPQEGALQDAAGLHAGDGRMVAGTDHVAGAKHQAEGEHEMLRHGHLG